MIHLRFDADCAPQYMTPHSAAADLVARVGVDIPPQTTVKIPTGVWIDRVEWDKVPAGCVPELQVRARSSLAYKKQLILSNGVGTIDADYPDEICVLLTNLGKDRIILEKGERVAQILLALAHRLPHLAVATAPRVGGFGSTGKSAELTNI